MWDVKLEILTSNKEVKYSFTLTMWDVKNNQHYRIQHLSSVLP